MFGSSIVAPIETPPEYNPPIQGTSTTCSDYTGDLTNVIWMDDFNDEDYSVNWTLFRVMVMNMEFLVGEIMNNNFIPT